LLSSPASPFHDQKNVNQLVDDFANRRHGATGAMGKEQLVHAPTSAVDANVKSRLGEQTLAGKKLEL